jgi:hypothetical protein
MILFTRYIVLSNIDLYKIVIDQRLIYFIVSKLINIDG